MKRFAHDLMTAAVATVLFPLGPALLTIEPVSGYFFYLLFSAIAYFTFGIGFSAFIDWLTGRLKHPRVRYLVSLPLYAAAGAIAISAILATLLRNLDLLHADTASFLLIGAVAALFMYHLSLALQAIRRK